MIRVIDPAAKVENDIGRVANRRRASLMVIRIPEKDERIGLDVTRASVCHASTEQAAYTCRRNFAFILESERRDALAPRKGRIRDLDNLPDHFRRVMAVPPHQINQNVPQRAIGSPDGFPQFFQFLIAMVHRSCYSWPPSEPL